MPVDLLARLARETAAGLEDAAIERLDDALAALTAGRHGAAIYLAGYAGEMLLKWAAFRIADPGGVYPVHSLLGAARGTAGSAPVPESWSGGHNLLFWLQYLRAKRSGAGLAPLMLDARIDEYVGWLVRHWQVGMRYVPWQVATRREAVRCIWRVRWMADNRAKLWR